MTTVPFVIEFTPQFQKRTIRHLLMDWDGTTSFTRSGWAEVMTEVYVENLPELAGESMEIRRKFSWEELMPLNGRPAIHQMEHLTKLITSRGGVPKLADHYQSEFQRRLTELVHARITAVRNKTGVPDFLLVPGVRVLLQELKKRGIGITLATGTPLPQVLEEIKVLEMENCFDSVCGPQDLEDREFTKKGVIENILAKNALDGSTLLALGDGPVEIAETKKVGGMAIAVATDEVEHGSGRIDDWKRKILLSVGADAVIPDYRQPLELLSAILV